MITEVEFKEIKENSKNFKYTNFEHFEYYNCEDMTDINIICNDEELILLSKESQETICIYFAANHSENVINLIKDIKNNITVGFVPSEFVDAFENIGFSVWSNWIDFFNNDIANTPTTFKDYNAIQFLKADEESYIREAANIGADLSRGFTAEKEEWFVEWLKDNDIIIVKYGDILVGNCCVSVYNNGTTVWVRRIAVKAEYQGRGYGKNLIEQALVYGINKGAARSFLAADVLNTNAIALYKKCGFVPQSDSGEITMKMKKKN
jgi:GNAT superfamily N-acetyltransferase